MFLESHDQRALASYAFILNNMDSNRSLLGQFIPFVLAVLKSKEDKKMELSPLCESVKNQFGFEIPRLAMLSIIDQAKKQGIVQKHKDGFFYPTNQALENIHLEEESILFQQKQKAIILDFIEFTKTNMGLFLTEDEATNQFSLFFQKNALPFLLTSSTGFTEQSFGNIPDSSLYCFHKYIIYLYSNACREFFKHITDIAFGYILTSLILQEGDDKNLSPQLKGIQIFLDTPIIIRLLGLEGQERQSSQEELLIMLRKEGAVLLLLQHTYNEIMNILNDVSQKISNGPTSSGYIGKTLYSCLRLGLSKGDIDSRIATFQAFLKRHEISIVDTTYTKEENRKYNIDQLKLEQTIKEVYGFASSIEVVQSRENAIRLDINSITEVYVRRKGIKTSDLSKSISFLLTSNTGLVFASRKYIQEEGSSGRIIPPCLTDSFVATILWSKSPRAVYRLNEQKLLADCYAALMPDENTVRKFLARVERLLAEKRITQDMYQLRMYKVTQELLSSKNHAEEISEETPDSTIIDILSAVEQKAKEEANVEYTKKENSLKDQLTEKELKIKDITLKNMQLETTLADIKTEKGKRIESRRRKISIFCWFVFWLLMSLGSFIIVFSCLNDMTWKVIFDILSGLFGGSLLVVANHIRKWIQKQLNYYLLQKDLW